LVPDLRPGQAQVQGAIRIAVVVVAALLIVLLVLYLIGRRFDITLFALLKVLAVPITVGVAVPWLNWLQKRREVEVENQRAQDAALHAYLDQMSQLLLDKERSLRQSKMGDEMRTVARARTLTVLARLDGDRKRSVVQFLYEAGLILQPPGFWVKGEGYVEQVGLSNATDTFIELDGADLSGANLSGADIASAQLHRADLSGANLSRTILMKAHLRDAVGYSEEQLAEADLVGATMPNGQKYEDWLKDSEGHKEDASPS